MLHGLLQYYGKLARKGKNRTPNDLLAALEWAAQQSVLVYMQAG